MSHSNDQLLQAQRNDGDEGDGAGDCCGKLEARTRLRVRNSIILVGQHGTGNFCCCCLLACWPDAERSRVYGLRAVASVQEGIAADRDDLHEAV